MEIYQAILLGIIQGLTEYLPVSSSAHLVYAQKILGLAITEKEAFIFDVLVQLGTLLGVLAYFLNPLLTLLKEFILGIKNNDIFERKGAKPIFFLTIATMPSIFFGLLLKDWMEIFFSDVKATSMFLLVTALLLFLAEKIKTDKNKELSYYNSLVIGLAQVVAFFPGISRSGSTIVAGMFLGLSRQEAAKFSFLMSLPVMFGASLIASRDLVGSSQLIMSLWQPLLVGFIFAAFTGYLVVKWFLNFVKDKNLYLFSLYCFLVGTCGLWYWW